LTTGINNTAKPLHKIFSDIPGHYDRINQIFTWGMDKKWRTAAARECIQNNPQRFLDLACGTGDLSQTVAQMAKQDTEITGMDFSQPMLEVARKKAQERGLKISYVPGDAASLPFPDAYFDCVGISFAFRNLTYRHPNAERHIAEVLRVLKPGGRFVAVESSQPKNRIIRAFDHFYQRVFVYPMGWWISGNRKAFNYLAVSASKFYCPEELRDILLKAGFSQVKFQRLFFGAAAIHVATK
jgi:demethylmenaquinone methyltransferase / 2-methoxy-6-polyprenyl-1,4-benzoquinol methylase